MADSEKIFYNAVNEALKADFRKMKQLLLQRKTWRKVWDTIGKNFPSIDPEKLWHEVISHDIRLALPDDKEYPKILKDIPGAPLGIYLSGSQISRNKKVAIVGTRKATAQGKETAKLFAKVLSDHGIEIVSGLALGIDAASHEGCLEGASPTLAVLGSGLTEIYPRQNSAIAKKILQKDGTLISEYPIAMPPLAYHFIERNRIVSGIADAIIVIEAPMKSGSLITTQFAIDQSRDVFVVPGSITHANYGGSNQLIRDGAMLVTNPKEILEYLGISPKSPAELLDLTDEERLVFDMLRNNDAPLTLDEIQSKTNVEIATLTKITTLMTLKNVIKEDGGRYFL